MLQDDATASGLTVNIAIHNPGSFIGVGLAGERSALLNSAVTMTSDTGVGAAYAVSVSGADARIENNDISVVSTFGGGGAIDENTAIAVTFNMTNITISGNTVNAFGGFTNNAVWVDNATSIAAGSTGNILINGGCRDDGVVSGQVEFTNGTTCP